MREDVNVLPDAVVGFQELGISSTGGDAALLDQGQGSINRFRRFTPAESYDPEVHFEFPPLPSCSDHN